MIRFTIPGPPVPYDRPRFNRASGAVFNSGPYATWKRGAAMLARNAAAGREPFTGPVELSVTVFHPRPKSRPAHVANEVWRSGAMCPAVSRSDLDNHVKAVSDALNDARVWTDDRLVVAILAHSHYHPVGSHPRTEVTVRPL